MKAVNIVGMGYSRTECTYDKETWGCNESYLFTKRLDRTYIFDDIEIVGKIRHWRWLKDKFKIYTKPDNIAKGRKLGLDNMVEFPLQAIIARFNSRYFTNTICYMIAHALYEGYEFIDLYGIDHLTYSSYTLERGGVEHWIGIAKGMGIQYRIAKGSMLLHTLDDKLYGYEMTYDKIVRPIERFLA